MSKPRILMFVVPLLLSLPSCSIVQPCVDNCRDDAGFFRECMDDDGLLCDGRIAMNCVDDVDAMLDASDQSREGRNPDWDQLLDEGSYHYCESPGEWLRSCKALSRTRTRREDLSGKVDRRQTCRDEGTSEWSQIMEDQDCDAFCDYLSGAISLEPELTPNDALIRLRHGTVVRPLDL